MYRGGYVEGKKKSLQVKDKQSNPSPIHSWCSWAGWGFEWSRNVARSGQELCYMGFGLESIFAPTLGSVGIPYKLG